MAKIDENIWWDCDTEGGGKGGPKEDAPPAHPASTSKKAVVSDVFMAGV